MGGAMREKTGREMAVDMYPVDGYPVGMYSSLRVSFTFPPHLLSSLLSKGDAMCPWGVQLVVKFVFHSLG